MFERLTIPHRRPSQRIFVDATRRNVLLVNDMGQPDVYHRAEEAGAAFDDPVLTLGNFDGLHLGHQKVIGRALERGREAHSPVLAVTFCPHPVRFFKPDAPPFRLTTDDQKFRQLLDTGVDAVLALEFDESLAELSPESFVDQIIHRDLGARRVVVGANFRFGEGRAGTTDDLDRLAGEREIEVDTCDELVVDGATVSSTRIREAVESADVETASRLLGRPYKLIGHVVHGDQRGRELGYPTANIEADTLLPGNGVYATRLHLDDGPSLPAATSIGVRPTFEDDEQRTVEAFVLELDPETDLYGEPVRLDFHKHLRPEREFDSAHRLVEQMSDDVSAVRDYFDEESAEA